MEIKWTRDKIISSDESDESDREIRPMEVVIDNNRKALPDKARFSDYMKVEKKAIRGFSIPLTSYKKIIILVRNEDLDSATQDVHGRGQYRII